MLNSSSENARRGFTQMELILSISIITFLLTLLLPAVQHAREVSRHATCINHLRQFGVALHAFVSTSASGELPTGYNDRFPVKWPGRKVSPQVQLLPHLECAPQYESILKSESRRYTDETLQFRIPTFRCPSDPSTIGLNYRVCTGAAPSVYADSRNGAGAFSVRVLNQGVRLSEIQDGLSNTAAMSERTVADLEFNRFSRQEDIWFSSAAEIDERVLLDNEVAANVCSSLRSEPGYNYAATSGHSFIAGGLINIYYNHIICPNSAIVDCSMDSCCEASPSSMAALPVSTSVAVVTARSFHSSAVVNLLLLDGAVIKTPANLSLTVWHHLGSRADMKE